MIRVRIRDDDIAEPRFSANATELTPKLLHEFFKVSTFPAALWPKVKFSPTVTCDA